MKEVVQQKESVRKRTMGLLSASSIGVGAMIGAGIFALIGIAVELAGNLAYLAFVIGGVVALFNSYSFAKLGVTFPSKGGPVEFLNQGFGRGAFTGTVNVVMWMGYILVNSLYARAFGEYGTALFGFEGSGVITHLLSSGVVLLFLGVNFIGASVVGKSELVIVLVKVVVLVAFGAIGLSMVEVQALALPDEINIKNIILAGAIVFMSYEGFGLVVNTAEDIKQPGKNLPRALFLSVVVVAIIYLVVTIAVVGNMSVDAILEAKEYVLAEAARPVMGETGFVVMGIAALFSTASAINATLYGPVNMVHQTAKARQLPGFMMKPLFGHESGVALLITGGIVIASANLLNLEAIAETGSMIFLVVYAIVNLSNYKLREKTDSKAWPIVVALAGAVGSFLALFFYEITHGGTSVYILLGVAALGFLLQLVYRGSRKEKPEEVPHSDV